MIGSYAARLVVTMSMGARETLILLFLRVVPTVGGGRVADRAKNVLREGNEQSDQSERAYQHQKHQRSFQHSLPRSDLSRSQEFSG